MRKEKRNLKSLFILSAAAALFLFQTTIASAHVVVKPNQVGSAAFQTFTVGVPNEKENPTTQLRLVIPDGLNYVSPNVKPGWTIDIKKSGEGEDAKVTEITWTGGSIPAGQRDDFIFSAQAPAEETTLIWKAYQTYEDGTVVAWDKKPGNDHDEAVDPYSETKVVKDLEGSEEDHHSGEQTKSGTQDNLPTILSIAAIIMAGGSLYLQTRKKK